jgi:NitT/TauT family transport system substrate-binding protein
MQDAGIPIDAVTIKNQSPAVGAANIAAGKIDAHADFCPWSELMEFRGTGRKIYDGSEAGVPYVHGTVVRKDFAEKYPEIVVAFIKATVDAAEFLTHAPQDAAERLEKWTGVEKEVQYLYFSKGGHLTSDPTIKPKWVDGMVLGHGVLARERQIPPLDFKRWVTDKYIRQAYKELGLDYGKAVAVLNDPKVTNVTLPVEVWHAKDGLKAYPTVAGMLKAVVEFHDSGQKVNASYVYDELTRLKLFGHVAYYVRGGDGAFKTFMRKPDAEAYAKKNAGTVMAFGDALQSVRG